MSFEPNEHISVVSVYNCENGLVIPKKIKWRSRVYCITKKNYYHKVRVGRIVMHVFHVTDGVMDFRIELNSDTLQWILKEVADGIADKQGFGAYHAY